MSRISALLVALFSKNVLTYKAGFFQYAVRCGIIDKRNRKSVQAVRLFKDMPADMKHRIYAKILTPVVFRDVIFNFGGSVIKVFPAEELDVTFVNKAHIMGKMRHT